MVAVSDPNAEYMNVAKRRLKQIDTGVNYNFHQSTAEDQSWLAADSLDMFTIFAAIGYAGLDELMQELSESSDPVRLSLQCIITAGQLSPTTKQRQQLGSTLLTSGSSEAFRRAVHLQSEVSASLEPVTIASLCLERSSMTKL